MRGAIRRVELHFVALAVEPERDRLLGRPAVDIVDEQDLGFLHLTPPFSVGISEHRTFNSGTW